MPLSYVITYSKAGGEIIATGYLQIRLQTAQQVDRTHTHVHILQKYHHILKWEHITTLNYENGLKPVAIYADETNHTNYDVELCIQNKQIYLSNISIQANCISYLTLTIDSHQYSYHISMFPLSQLSQYLHVISTFYRKVIPPKHTIWDQDYINSIRSFQQLLCIHADGMLSTQTWSLLQQMYHELQS